MKHKIKTKDGLTNSQMYTRDNTNRLTLDSINFEKRFKNILQTDNSEYSRHNFAILISDIFTHYRNIRSDIEDSNFWDIANDFEFDNK